MSQTLQVNRERMVAVRRAGWVCFLGGLIGVADAVMVAAWPDSVGSDRYSYPFSPTGYKIAHVSFAAQHILLGVGLAALLALPVISVSRAGRVGAKIAVAGVVVLVAVEFVSFIAAHSATDSSRANIANGLYMVPVVLFAAGLLTAAIGARRGATVAASPRLTRLLIVMGIYPLVPMTPMIAGPHLLGQIGLGGFMALFAVLGYEITRAAGEPAQSVVTSLSRSAQASEVGRA